MYRPSPDTAEVAGEHRSPEQETADQLSWENGSDSPQNQRNFYLIWNYTWCKNKNRGNKKTKFLPQMRSGDLSSYFPLRKYRLIPQENSKETRARADALPRPMLGTPPVSHPAPAATFCKGKHLPRVETEATLLSQEKDKKTPPKIQGKKKWIGSQKQDRKPDITIFPFRSAQLLERKIRFIKI